MSPEPLSTEPLSEPIESSTPTCSCSKEEAALYVAVDLAREDMPSTTIIKRCACGVSYVFVATQLFDTGSRPSGCDQPPTT